MIGQPDAGLKVLVTGAAGFVGSHVCDRLLAEGHSVWGVDNFDANYPPETKRSNLSEAVRNTKMHVVEGDVRDTVLVEGLFSDVDFDAVVHLAGHSGVRASFDDPDICLDVNVMGTLSILERMRRHDVPVLVLGSSSAVYGDTDSPPLDEDAPADRPTSPYAASKRSAEMLAHAYHQEYGISVHCLRIFAVVGPRQRPNLAIHEFARLLAANEPIPLHGCGTGARDYTYVGDIVEAIVTSLHTLRRELADDAPASYEVINLGHDDPVRLVDLVEAISRAMELSPRLEAGPTPPGGAPVTFASGEKARRLLGYRPSVDLEEGLARFVEWFSTTADGVKKPQTALPTPAAGEG